MGSSADFSIKVWAVVIFGAPLMIGLLLNGFDGIFYFFAVIWGIVLSLPALILFLILTSIINNRDLKYILKKTILAVSGLLMTWLSFEVVSFSEGIRYIYCGTLVASILIFPLRLPESPRKKSEELADDN